MISFDIVIPHYGPVQPVQRMLDNLCTINREGLNRLILVENGPKSGLEQRLSRWEDLPIVYIYTEKPGLTDARNLGIEHSDADFVIFLDNDLTLDPQSLQAYRQAFHQQGQMYFYGGPVTPEYEVNPPKWLLEHVPPSVKGFDLGPNNQRIDGGHFLGGNHALSRKAITECSQNSHTVYEGQSATGTSGGGVGEEHRLQSRLLGLGYKAFYVAQANVYHPVPRECLTKEWACHRRFRRGMTDADKVYSQSQRFIFNMPVWILKLYMLQRFLEWFWHPFSAAKSIRHGVQRAWAQGVITQLRSRQDNR